MQDIISAILERRKQDAKALGFCMGVDVPSERTRAVVPFLRERGVILEVKRASPSKGDIAPYLDAAKTALSYRDAGAKAISVLTEEHWFKGSLKDLIAAADAAGDDVAVLRKDFLYHPDEVDVAFRCGADAVLVIARMLDENVIASMLERAACLGMSALVELRAEDDVHKVKRALDVLSDKCNEVTRARSANAPLPNIVYGVNARDLKDFSIDCMRPLEMLEAIRRSLGEVKVITESGVLTPRAAKMAGSMGFYGLLLGEAAARSPSGAGAFVEAFAAGERGGSSGFWERAAKKLAIIRRGAYRPLIKICGITSVKDAMAALSGADFLGFVFWQKSKRCCSEETVRQVRKAIDGFTWEEGRKPLLVGVVADNSVMSAIAIGLAKEGVLDAVQFHACMAEEVSRGDYDGIAHYAAVNVNKLADIDKVRALSSSGEMRVLLDSSTKTLPGGTGVRVDTSLCREAAGVSPLWLAGGITADNVAKIVCEVKPELIDIASGVESSPGVKSLEKMQKLFANARPSGGVI